MRHIVRKCPNNKKYKRIVIDGKYYDMPEEGPRKTRAIRDPATGRLKGRKSGLPPFFADTDGKYIVLTKDLDVNKDGVAEFKKGQIIARMKNEVKRKPTRISICVKRKHLKERRDRELKRLERLKKIKSKGGKK